MTAGTRTALDAQSERRAYGWGVRSEPIDAAIFYARDIALVPSEGAVGDLALADGFDALEQDLRTAFGTALGSDPLNVGHGFDGMRAISEETDFLKMRERIRGAVVALLRADPRIVAVQRVLIGSEIAAFRSGETASPAPRGEYGIVDVEATFKIVGGAQATLSMGPILAGA